MIARTRLPWIALGVALCVAPLGAQAQNRRGAATTPSDRDDRADRDPAPAASSRARDRGRARAQQDEEAPRESREARIRAAAEREQREERDAEERDPEEREAPARASGIRGLASEGPRAAAFVPRGWVLEQQAEGDLTGDRRPDLALVIRQQRPDDADHDRALVVLERGADGVYARIGVGTRFLLCSSCYGSVAGPVGAPLLAIRRGVLAVEQLSGSREARERTLRFRLDAESGRLMLVGEELASWDRAEGRGSRTRTNHLSRTRTTERWERDARRDRETRTTETHHAVDLGERVSLEDCE